MPQLEPPLPNPTSSDKGHQVVEKSEIPEPKKISDENIQMMHPSAQSTSIPSLGEPEVGGNAKRNPSAKDYYSTNKQKRPGNPVIPFSQDKDDIQFSLVSPGSIVLSANRTQKQMGQRKAVIPSAGDFAQEQPSSQDIRHLLDFNRHQPKPSGTRKKQWKTGMYWHLFGY